MSQYKQVIVLREDINMSTGKKIAQACHASLKAYKKSDSGIVSEWESQGSKKIALKSDKDTMESKCRKAESKGVVVSQVKDAGETELKPGTKTAIAIGPDEESKVDSITGDLKLIK